MQVSSSLIAAQAAAREAQARFQAQIKAQNPVQPSAQPSSALALNPAADGFAPLPLKQVAPQAPTLAASPQGNAPARLGQHIDITV